MNRLAALILSAALAAGASASAITPAASADPSGRYGSDGTVCGETWVLSRISRNFRHQVRNVPGLPDVQILDFRDIHLRRFEPKGETWPVERVYCGATAQLSDGRDRAVWYFIESGMGFAGLGSNVEACVSGFDRWYVYDGRCRVAR